MLKRLVRISALLSILVMSVGWGANWGNSGGAGGGGTGDVVGPAGSVTADTLAIFSGTTGELLKGGGPSFLSGVLALPASASGGQATFTEASAFGSTHKVTYGLAAGTNLAANLDCSVNTAGAMPAACVVQTGGQTPWIADIDADGFNLDDARYINMRAPIEGTTGTSLQIPNATGWGFAISSQESQQYAFSGASRDSTTWLGYNINRLGTNMGNFYNPSLIDSFEHNFDTGLWPNDVATERHTIAGVGYSTSTLLSGTGFAADNVVSIEDPTGGHEVVALGIITSVTAGASGAVNIDWLYTEAPDTNPPANGDRVRGVSTSTVVPIAGTFDRLGGGVWVYPSTTCGTDAVGSTALLSLTAATGNALTWVRSDGVDTDIIPGNCIRQFDNGAAGAATATLGAISTANATTFNSGLTIQGDTNFRPFTSAYFPHRRRADMKWYSNQWAFVTDQTPTLGIGGPNVASSHWIKIVSNIGNEFGAGLVGVIGDNNVRRNMGIFGRWTFFPDPYVSATTRVDVSANNTLTGLRAQTLADVSGKIAVVSSTAATGGLTYTVISVDGTLDSCDELCTAHGLAVVPATCEFAVAPTDGVANVYTHEATTSTDLGGAGLVVRAACR